MTEVGDKFTKKLDFSHTGIGKIEVGIIVQREYTTYPGGAMGQMMKLLKEKDPVLHKHLVSM